MRPLDELERPLDAAPGGRWIERLVGVAAALTGLALGALVLTAAFNGIAAGSGALPLVLGAVVGVLSAFFLSVSWRLLLIRPNRHGGLLSPVFSLLAGAFFVLAGLAMAGDALRHGRFGELEGALGAITLGALATWLGWRRRRARRAA